MEIPGRVQEQCSVSCCGDKAMENGSLGAESPQEQRFSSYDRMAL